MNLLEYQKQAITTKIYDHSVAIPYIVLGICGEASELHEKIVEIFNKPECVPDLTLMKKEIGDVMWYLAGWAEENGLNLDDLALLRAMAHLYIVDKNVMLNNLFLFSGQIAEYTKKALRDNFEDVAKGVFPASKMVQTNIAVSQLIYTVQSVAYYFKLDFNQILQDNLDKLNSRKERGVLGGSGDTR